MNIDKELSIVEILFAIRRHILGAILVGCLCVGGALYYALTHPIIYKSHATLLPVDQQAQLGMGNIASLITGQASGSKTTDKFLLFLNSRTLSHSVVNRMGNRIMTALYEDAWDTEKKEFKDKLMAPKPFQVADSLKGHMKFEMGDQGVTTIKIIAMFEDPELTVEVIDAYVEELRIYLNKNELTLSQRTQNFLRGQLVKGKQELLEAGQTLGDFHRIYNTRINDSTASIVIGNSSDVIQSDTPHIEDGSETLEGIKMQVPVDVLLTYLTGRQKVLAEMTSNLEHQYMISSIEVEHRKLGFHVIDQPVVPIQRFKPKRKVIVVVGGAAGCVLAACYIFMAHFISENKKEWVIEYRRIADAKAVS